MSTMSIRLGSWLLKQSGKGEKGVREHFEEVMYTREFQREAATPSRTDVVKLHQVPSIARMYQLGELDRRPTNVVPNARFNYTVCLIREDITRLEVDVLGKFGSLLTSLRLTNGSSEFYRQDFCRHGHARSNGLSKGWS